MLQCSWSGHWFDPLHCIPCTCITFNGIVLFEARSFPSDGTKMSGVKTVFEVSNQGLQVAKEMIPNVCSYSIQGLVPKVNDTVANS